LCLKHELPEVQIDPLLFDDALKPLQRMLEISATPAV
jgi:quinolinate synthase